MSFGFQINCQAVFPESICVPYRYMQICIYITQAHIERYLIYGISLSYEHHSLINLAKLHRGFLAIFKSSEVAFGCSCCLFHSLQVILQLAMGCLIAVCSLPPCSAQVRRIDEEQKWSVTCGYLTDFMNHWLGVVVFVFFCGGASKLHLGLTSLVTVKLPIINDGSDQSFIMVSIIVWLRLWCII